MKSCNNSWRPRILYKTGRFTSTPTSVCQPFDGRNSHKNGEEASVGTSRMQILVKLVCNYLERPFIDLFNDITYTYITQSLDITFA